MIDYIKYWDDYHLTQNTTNVPIDYILDYCFFYLNPELRTLEIGCGSGEILLSLSQRFKYLYACDISTLAVKRIPATIFKVADICVNALDYLPYKTGSMNFIIISQLLSTITDLDKIKNMIREIRRVLCSNGLLLIIDYTYSSRKRYIQEILEGETVNHLYTNWSNISFIHYYPEQYVRLFAPCDELVSQYINIKSCKGHDSDGVFSLLKIK